MKTKIGIGAGVAFAFLLISAVTGSFYSIDEGNRGIKLTNGAFTSVVEPGFGYKLPFIQSVVEMSVRTQKTETHQPVYSKDKQTADAAVVLNYHYADVENIYRTYGTTAVDVYVTPILFDEIKNVFGQFTADDIIGKRSELTHRIMAAVLERTKGSGIVIESVNLTNVDFDNTYEEAVRQRMTAEVEVLKVRQNGEKEKVLADIKRTQADASAYQTLAAAKAEAESIKIRGEALRSNQNLVELTLAEKWDGKMPQMMVPGGATPLIDLRSQVSKGN